MRLVNWRALVAGAAGLGLAACGDDVTVTPPPLQYTVNPTSVTCNTGQTTAVGLTVSGGSGTPAITFSAQNGGITVTGNGSSATVLCGNTAGASAVNFTITSGGQTVTGSIPVTIQGTGNTSPIAAISVTPTAASLVPGGTTIITSQVTLANGAPASTSTAVTFSSSDTTVARVTTNANGTATVTAVNSAANTAGRQAVITATPTANTNLRAFTTITISPASALVSGFQVTPGSVSLATGQTQQITANVTLAAGAPAGTSTGVTYTSSDTSIARVSSTGLITAGSRSGTATITVASQAAPSVTQQIGVTVTTPVPVQLSIQSLETVNAAGNQVAIDPTNVTGRLIATLNLEQGSFAADSVVATLGNARTVCQRFGAALQAAYRARSSGGADVAPIQCIINTAQFDTTTGAASVQNGAQQFRATVYFRPVGGGTTTGQTAQIARELNLNNLSGYYVRVSNTPTAAQRANSGNQLGQTTGPQGVLWRAGSLNVRVIPVFFTTPPTGTAGTQTINVTLADVNNPGGFSTQPLSFTPGSNTAPDSVVFTGASSTTRVVNPSGNTPLTGYTSPNAGQANGGTQIIVGGGAATTILNASGAPQMTAVNGGAAQPAYPVVFIDNTAPEARAQFVGPNFLTNGAGNSGFLNGSFSFNSLSQADQNTCVDQTGCDFGGVDRVGRTFFFATASSLSSVTAGNIVGANQSAVTSTGAIAIPENPTTNTYVAAARLTDALGNARNQLVEGTAGSGAFTFGVSTATPVLTIGDGSIGNNTGLNAASGTQQIAGSATSPVGFGQSILQGTLQLTTPNGTFCATSNQVAGNTLSHVDTTATASNCPTLNFNNISINAQTIAQGVYTATFVARDVAGNVSGSQTRTFVVDRTAPTVTNADIATRPLRGGQPATFTATATDNLDIINSLGVIDYPVAGGAFSLRYDGASIGNAFDNVFTRTANLSITTGNFIRSVARGTASTTLGSASFTPQTLVGGVAVGAQDGGGNIGFSTNLQAAAVQALLDQNQSTRPLVDAGNTNAGFFSNTFLSGLQRIAVTFTTSAASNQATVPSLFGTAANGPQSVTINVTQFGPTNAAFSTPFTRFDIFQLVNTATPFGNPTYRFLGTLATGGVTVPSGGQASINSSFTFTPTSYPSAGNTSTADLLIIGYDANGNGLAITVPTITINP